MAVHATGELDDELLELDEEELLLDELDDDELLLELDELNEEELLELDEEELLELDEEELLLELDDELLLVACDCAMIVDSETDRGLNCMTGTRPIFSSSGLVLPCPFPPKIPLTFPISPPDFDSSGGFVFPVPLATEDLPFFAIVLTGARIEKLRPPIARC